MLSKDASEEIQKATTCQTQTRDLGDRFESDFGKWRNELFAIPTAEGKWDSFTTNRPSTDANKLINILASSRVKLWIPITDENQKQRKRLSRTEQFVCGVIALRDSICQTIPETLPLHASMSWFAPMRGWLALLCYLYEENKKVIPHIAVWDLLNTFWISGSKGLLWAGYKRNASKEELSAEYKDKDFTASEDKKLVVYDIWDTEEHGVAVNGEWLRKEEHSCGHVPVLILPGGSVPLIQSGEYTDTIKNVGESCYANNRHLFDTESRMGSYILTMAGRAAKIPMAHEYDSTKSSTLPDLTGSPFEKGAEILIDVGRGEKLVPLTSPELTRDFFAFWEYLQGRLSVGGQAPVSFGQINQALPAAGINILRHASMENIKPPQKLMERAYAWLAHELVSQYKSGGFKKMEVQGIDGSNRKFKVEVEPKDIDDSWNFEANLIADFPQDKMANVGMAVQLKESGLLSNEEIIDQLNLSDDPDLTQEKLDRQHAYEFAFIREKRIAAALLRDGNKEDATAIMEEIEQRRRVAMTERPKGIASQPGITSAVRPSADTSAVVPEPPQASGLKRFLSRFGASEQ